MQSFIPHCILHLPQHLKTSSPLNQLARGDIFFALGVHVFIKWSKTLQRKNAIKMIKLPSQGSNPLCPVAALEKLLQMSPGDANAPLFQIKQNNNWIPLIDTEARRNLS